MSPQQRAQKKAKLLARASDHRGNEFERMLAQRQFQRLCADEERERQKADAAARASVPGRPEFNRMERGVIHAGTALLVGASILIDWLKVHRRQRRRGRARPV